MYEYATKLHFKSDCILWGADCRHIGVQLLFKKRKRLVHFGVSSLRPMLLSTFLLPLPWQLLLFWHCRVVSWRHFEHKAQICQQPTQTLTPTLFSHQHWRESSCGSLEICFVSSQTNTHTHTFGGG